VKVPSPAEVGLPPKFDKWRLGQEQAISDMMESKHRVTALSAPTGFGKSPTYIGYAILSGQPTCIVTNSRGLQDQLMRDFSSIGLVDIRGRSNYQCASREDYTCQEGYATQCPFKGTVGCPASQAEMRAATSSLVVTNYDKWIASRRFGQGLSHFTQVIFDEGHDAPDAVAKAMQVILSDNEVTNVLKMDYPRGSDVFGCWKVWASYAREVAEDLIREQKYKISTVSSPKASWVKELYHLMALLRRLSILSTARPEDWIVEEDPNQGFQFDPIRPARYAESTLLLHTPRIIIVSATLRPKTLYMLGIGKINYDFFEFESDFSPQRCPIYWVPTMRVDARTPDLSQLWVRLDQIIAKRQDRKGIIHTISYARQQDVLRKSRFRDRMYVNSKGIPATSMVEIFKASDPGTILVSPSVGTGYDFPGKTCEWQFLAKIPFPDGRTKINRARNSDDNEYGAYQAMQTMVQAFGRGMRSKEDQCEGFICDDHLTWFIPKFRHLAPNSFYRLFRKVEVLPQPPERLP
jgi:ATP-dependent DNA helicase DinG